MTLRYKYQNNIGWKGTFKKHNHAIQEMRYVYKKHNIQRRYLLHMSGPLETPSESPSVLWQVHVPVDLRLRKTPTLQWLGIRYRMMTVLADGDCSSSSSFSSFAKFRLTFLLFCNNTSNHMEKKNRYRDATGWTEQHQMQFTSAEKITNYSFVIKLILMLKNHM